MDDLVGNWTGALATGVNAAMTSAFGAYHDSTSAALLSCLYFRDATVGQLGETLGLTGSGAVRLVDRLESDGLIERRAKDGRVVSVRLTASGRRVARRLERERLDAIDRLLSVLGPDERAAFGATLDKILHAASFGSGTARTVCRFCDHARCDGPRCPIGRSLGERGQPRARATQRAVR